MPIKKPYTIRSLNPQEVPHLDENFNRLFAHKLEARFKWEGSSTAVSNYIHNYIEYGQRTGSATGSATVTIAIPLQERAEKVLYVDAHVISPVLRASVTEVTASTVWVTVTPISATGISAATSGVFTVYSQLVGSNPGN